MPTGKHYIGSRKSKTIPLQDIGVQYFTSSHPFRLIFRTEPRTNFKIKVVSLHETYQQAYEKEQQYLQRVNVPNEKFFNQTHFFGSFPLTEEAKLKQQAARLRLAKDPEWLLQNSLSHMGHIPVVYPETRVKHSLYRHTPERRHKISVALKAYRKRQCSLDAQQRASDA